MHLRPVFSLSAATESAFPSFVPQAPLERLMFPNMRNGQSYFTPRLSFVTPGVIDKTYDGAVNQANLR